jgi:hypothetical protein
MNRGKVCFEGVLIDVVEVFVFVSRRSLSVLDAPSFVNKQAMFSSIHQLHGRAVEFWDLHCTLHSFSSQSK